MQRDEPSAHDLADGQLWASVRCTGSPTVVFEAGGGEDSSVWAECEPLVRDHLRVQTMVYDRAGLGRSPPSPPPYRIDEEADALRRELDRRRITAPVMLVAHSYGGFVGTLVAAADPRIAGVVLVDANLAGFFDEAQIDRLLATYRPQFPALEQKAPEAARVMIPLIEAYPATVARLSEVDIPDGTPTIDIVPERTWVETPEELEAIRRAHRDFVAASPHRRAVFAEDSGHHVMRDRPAVVLDAVAEIVATVRARQ
ncbi:MAG: alpha/beta fold hydrolase [Gaiellales bacterium]